MDVITLQSDAFQQIVDGIADIKDSLQAKFKQNPLIDTWLDVQETCQLLKISKRTLQSYRDNGILPFSQISGKIYFKAADIEAHLKSHYQKAFTNRSQK